MSDPCTDHVFPRGPLLAAAGLVVGSLLIIAATRITGIGVMRVPDASLVASRDLRFEDNRNGGVSVMDARSNQAVGQVAPGVGGFVRATLRGLGRERKRRGIGPHEPFRLAVWNGGRLTLEDLATGRRIELEAFGPTNAAAFATFLQTETRLLSMTAASK